MKITFLLTLALCCSSLAPAVVKAQDWQSQRTQRPQDPREQQNQDACMGDAMTLCGEFVPDRERVAACLLSNRHRVSAPCRAMLAHWHG